MLTQPLAHFMDGYESEICHAEQGEKKDDAEAVAEEAAGDGEESEDCVNDPCKEVVDGVEEVVEEVVDGGGGGEEVFKHAKRLECHRCLVVTC